MPSTNTDISCRDLSILIRIWEPFPADSPSSGAAADFDLGCAGAEPGLGCPDAGCSDAAGCVRPGGGLCGRGVGLALRAGRSAAVLRGRGIAANLRTRGI